MTERTKDDQIPTSKTEGKQPVSQDFDKQPAGEKTGEETGETEGGFVAPKMKDGESGYVQGERKDESDIEGSSKNFGTNGE
jgi:hypothetical protein